MKTIKKKLLKKFQKELDGLVAERKFIDVKIEALTTIVKALEEEKESEE